MNRKISQVLKKFADKMKANPIVEQLPNDPIPGITTTDHIKELQELLVQTCIDYINKNGLTDLYSVYFNADFLNESARWGSWQSCTDSYIKVEGLESENYKRKDGTVIKMPYRYTIGERM